MRFLTASEQAEALAICKRPRDAQRAYLEQFAPETFRAWRGWVWGRQNFEIGIGTPDEIPATVAEVCTLEAIEYIAKKRDPDGIARRATYRHEHDAPYARVVTAPAAMPSAPTRSSRGAPSFRGPSLFVLGELFGIEGTAPSGDRVYWRAPKGMVLAGCPVTHDMHVIRQGAARSSAPPIWILRGRSPYRLTDRGIVR